jgi:hypothetical protein
MKVSKQFLRDFAYLANLYAWTPVDIEEIKAQTRANPEVMRRYWTNLAIAHRAGYEQTPTNGLVRLREWCAQQGWPDPYLHDLDPVTEDASLARLGTTREQVLEQYGSLEAYSRALYRSPKNE